MGNLPKVEIRSEDGVHGEVWIDGMKLKGVRRVSVLMPSGNRHRNL